MGPHFPGKFWKREAGADKDLKGSVLKSGVIRANMLPEKHCRLIAYRKKFFTILSRTLFLRPEIVRRKNVFFTMGLCRSTCSLIRQSLIERLVRKPRFAALSRVALFKYHFSEFAYI